MNLATAAAAFTRQDIASDHPIVSTVLPFGERCQIVTPPAVPAGTLSLTIRKVAPLTMTLDEFDRRSLFADVRQASDELSADERELVRLRDAGQWRAFLERAVASRRKIVISEATGSGKTTLAKGLVALIPAHERMLTIEDAAEPYPSPIMSACSTPRTDKASPGSALANYSNRRCACAPIASSCKSCATARPSIICAM